MIRSGLAALLLAVMTTCASAVGVGVENTGARQGVYATSTGSIASGGNSQQALAANQYRAAYAICNTSTAPEYLNYGSGAASLLTLPIAAGSCVSHADSFVTTQQVNIFGATTGQTYFVMEGV